MVVEPSSMSASLYIFKPVKMSFTSLWSHGTDKTQIGGRGVICSYNSKLLIKHMHISINIAETFRISVGNNTKKVECDCMRYTSCK